MRITAWSSTLGARRPGAVGLSWVLVALCVATAPGLVACTSSAVDQRAGGDRKYVSLGGDVKKLLPEFRGQALSMRGPSLDGAELDVAEHRGKVIVLNFWASWCGPCISEAPNLVSAASDLGTTNVAFLGVNVRDGSSGANGRAFERNHAVPYPSFKDPSSQLSARVAQLSPTGIPTTLILDKQGRVAVRFPRPVLYSELVRAVRGLLAEPS